MMSSPEARIDLDALKRVHPLTAVVSGAGIPLRPAGSGRLIGCCPFHADREPSFMVDQRDQHFHCFACQAHGDVIDFVMRREGLDFRQAIERLAVLPAPPKAPVQATPKRERRWDRLTLDEQVAMNTAAAVYQHRLWHEPRALAYLRGRDLPDWLIRSAGLGYADGHSLEAWFRRHSGLRIAEELGLLGPKGREHLAGRVVVPELRGGQCIWLIGRRLDDTSERPKYLALPGERPVLGQEHAAGRREVFLAEGVVD